MKIILSLLLCFAPTCFANAQSVFSIQANCSFDRANGNCYVYNQFNRPIFCVLTASGQTYSGAYINEIARGWIPPGMQATVFVSANNPNNDPLQFVDGVANCRF